jgi:hypothetical protein
MYVAVSPGIDRPLTGDIHDLPEASGRVDAADEVPVFVFTGLDRSNCGG